MPIARKADIRRCELGTWRKMRMLSGKAGNAYIDTELGG